MLLALALATCLHQQSPKASGDEPVRASAASKSKTRGYDRRYCGVYCDGGGPSAGWPLSGSGGTASLQELGSVAPGGFERIDPPFFVRKGPPPHADAGGDVADLFDNAVDRFVHSLPARPVVGTEPFSFSFRTLMS